MRNNMDATDGQIQSIKDLCSFQQQLGVISDEVLLQGSQELTIHLQNADSLMIPHPFWLQTACLILKKR